jgi:hypothetical protein
MSFQPDRSAPAWTRRAAIAAAGLVILMAFLAGASEGIGTADRDHGFSPVDRPWAQWLLPALDTPYTTPWSPSALAGRGAMAVASGRRTAPRDLAAVATAAAIVMFGLWLTTAGVAHFPVLLTMLGMAAGSTLWWRGIYWTPDALSPLGAMATAWAGWRWLVSRRLVFVIAAGIAAVLAMSEDPAWLACVPAAVVFLWHRLSSRRDRVMAVAAGSAVAACATLPLLAHAAAAHASRWAPLAGVAPPDGLAAWMELVDIQARSAGALIANLSREFTPIGAGLALIGVAVSWRAPGERRSLAALAIGLAGWQWFVPHSRIDPVSLPLVLAGWAAVAVALDWLPRTVSPRVGHALVVVLALLLIGEPAFTRGRMAALGRDTRSNEHARMAYAFPVTDLPAGTALVAESRRVDATVLLTAQRAGAPAILVPQDLEAVAAWITKGRPLFAFANGRTNLAPFGFLFERAWVGNTAVSAITGRAACAPLTPGDWTDVSLLLSSGAFIVHGAGPGTAPGGVRLRMTDAADVRFGRIEPRSIPYLLEATTGGATLHIPETGRRDPVTFTFAAAPHDAVATADDNSPAMICPGVQLRDLTLGANPIATAALSMASATAFGPGWHAPERDPDVFRWTSGPRSLIRITAATAGPIRVTITATPAARSAQQPAIGLTVNACTYPTQAMPPGQGDYEWEVPATCWRAGTNQLWVAVTPLVSPASLGSGPDTRLLGARVGAVRLARVAGAQKAK